MAGISAMVLTSEFTGESAVNYGRTWFSNHLLATLSTYILWLLIITVFLKIGIKGRYFSGKTSKDIGLIIAIIYLLLDIFVWGIFGQTIGLAYFSVMAPWLGYIFLYLYTSYIHKKLKQ